MTTTAVPVFCRECQRQIEAHESQTIVGGYRYHATCMTRRLDVSDEPMMQFFSYSHLPEHLQSVSRDFFVLADKIVTELPRNAERTAALRKLLEAKDCAVRARLFAS